jgi:hypothetical protein
MYGIWLVSTGIAMLKNDREEDLEAYQRRRVQIPWTRQLDADPKLLI